MKKVLMYNGQLFIGGIERVLINYLEPLSKEEDLEITLLIRVNNPEENIFAKDVPKNIKLEYLTTEEEDKFKAKLAKGRKNNLFYRTLYQIVLEWDRIKIRKRVKEYFENQKFDILVDFDSSLGKYIKNDKIKKVMWCHFSLAAENPKRIKRLTERFKKYEKIVTICDDMLEEFHKLYPEIADRGVRIYNPIPIEDIKRLSEDESELSEKEKELIKKPYLVSVARMIESKGQGDLVEIYSELKKSGIEEKLYIVGDGDYRGKLEKKIKDFGLEEDVILIGQKSNPYIWMKNATLFLHASYGEGLPTVFLESMSCGTPVIAYDCPTGPKEILGNGKYGEIVPLGDKKIFQEKVLHILKNREILEKYEKIIEERIKDFSSKTIIQEFKEKLLK